jgi:ferric-dicitrate binding protein FerR (iron transport regulator)
MAELDQNIDFEIIWKKIHDQTTEEEEILLKSWLSSHSSHRKYYEDAINYYSNGTQFANSPTELKKALKKIHRKTGIHSPYINTQIITITSIAASILILIYFQFLRTSNNPEQQKTEQVAQSIVPGSNKAVLVLADGTEHDLSSGNNSVITEEGSEIKNSGNKLEYTSKSAQTTETKYNTLKIPRGGEYFLVLADGTKVWLNSETTLRFPVQFASDIRRVELTGEAYFEVSRNENVPFIVSSGNQQVKVLGTQFNISSYPDNQSILTTLVEGSVEVSLEGNPAEKTMLKPSEQSYLSMNESQILKRNVDVAQYVAWKDGRFVFQDQMLEDIMKTLSKWYDVQVVFTNEDDKKLRFTGNLERYTDFNNILGKIERTNEVEFEITDKLITIK